MKAAVVTQPGAAPIFGDFPDPGPAAGEVEVAMSAAAISQFVRARAAGKHYSARSEGPVVPGVDGIGRLDDGRRVYVALPAMPYGTMAARCVVPAAHCRAIPDELDDVTAAAIANPGVSSWAALTRRASIRPGESVLINGATGMSGQLAVQIARHLGAGRIIVTGRNRERLATLRDRGADVAIPLTDDMAALAATFEAQVRDGIDIVLDYLWGESARALLIAAAKASPEGKPFRFVQIGSMSGGEIVLPAAVLRASAITLTGSGLGSIALADFIAATGEMLEAAGRAGFRIPTQALPLAQVTRAWSLDDSDHRIVLTMDG